MQISSLYTILGK